jgi:hypothetical protein
MAEPVVQFFRNAWANSLSLRVLSVGEIFGRAGESMRAWVRRNGANLLRNLDSWKDKHLDFVAFDLDFVAPGLEFVAPGLESRPCGLGAIGEVRPAALSRRAH